MKKSLRALAAAAAVMISLSAAGISASAETMKIDRINIDDNYLIHILNEDGSDRGPFTGCIKLGELRSYYREGACIFNRWLKVGGKLKYYLGSEGIVISEISDDGKELRLIDEDLDFTLPLTQESGKIDLVVLYISDDILVCAAPDMTEETAVILTIFTDTSVLGFKPGDTLEVAHEGIYSVKDEGLESGIILPTSIRRKNFKVSSDAKALIQKLESDSASQ